VSKLSNAAFCFVITTVLSLCPCRAQEAQPLPRHPGDVIKYEIKFDGQNAERIKSVYARMNTGQQPPKDQAGFATQISTNGEIQATSPRTFIIEMRVPDNLASGEYKLFIGANAGEGSATYSDGQDFNIPPVSIENPKKFAPPAIKVTPLP